MYEILMFSVPIRDAFSAEVAVVTAVKPSATVQALPSKISRLPLVRDLRISPIATGNACAAVQRAATFVTTSNEDDGAADAMERRVL